MYNGVAAPQYAAADAPRGPLIHGLNWQPLDLTLPDMDIAALVRQWPGLDQSVPGVTHMEGGSRAGYARWQAWRSGGGIGAYPGSRNDALKRNGVSR